MSKKQVNLATQTILAIVLIQGIVLAAVYIWGKMSANAAAVVIPAITARQFLLTFLALTILLLFIIRTLRQRVIFEAIFIFTVFSGIWFLFSLIAPSYGLFIAVALAAVRYLAPYVIVQNILIIIGAAGIGAALGSATYWQTALIILIVLVVYDVVAVYGTKHMVTMFKGLAERGVIFALIIPENPRLLLSRWRDIAPGKGISFLGTGDLALPAFFVASAAQTNFYWGIGAAIGSIIGICISDWLFRLGKGRPMPALPGIVAGTLSGFFVAMICIK